MSDFDDLYREIILDHYRTPRNRGELESPPASRTEGFNPLCGDEVVVYLDVVDGVIADVKIGGQGCSISQASASMMTAAVKGKTIEEAHAVNTAFKAMMSIHEHAIGGDGTESGAADEAAGEFDPTNLGLGDLEALRGVVKFPVRIKCATLGWNTLLQGLEDPQVNS